VRTKTHTTLSTTLFALPRKQRLKERGCSEPSIIVSTSWNSLPFYYSCCVFLVSLFLESIDLSPGGYSVCDVQEKFRSAIYEFPKVLVHDPRPPPPSLSSSPPPPTVCWSEKGRKEKKKEKRSRGVLENMIIDIVVARGEEQNCDGTEDGCCEYVFTCLLVLFGFWFWSGNNPPPFFFREGWAPSFTLSYLSRSAEVLGD
jgi:hypothetical protein